MRFFFGLSSTDLLWQVDGEHDIQTIRILSYLTLALGVYVCVCATRWISEGGRLHCATGLAWQNVSATSYEISLSLYALICAYPNSYDVRDSSCVVMVVFVAALGSHSFFASPKPRAALGEVLV